MGKSATLQIEDQKVDVTNLDKVMYPKIGFTKGDVIDYYVRISPVLLPHLEGRAVTLRRFPHGAADEASFYEKRASPHRPDWVSTVTMPISGDETIDCADALRAWMEARADELARDGVTIPKAPGGSGSSDKDKEKGKKDKEKEKGKDKDKDKEPEKDKSKQ